MHCKQGSQSEHILFVAPWIPGTLRPRSLGLLGRLSQNFEVHVLVVSFEADPDLSGLDALRLGSITLVRANRYRQAFRAALRLWRKESLQQLYLDVPGVREQIKRIASEHRLKFAYFNVLRSTQWVDALDAHLLKVVDLDEYRSEYYRLTAVQSKSRLRRAIGRIEAVRMERAERKVMHEFDLVLVSSPCDLRSDFGEGVRARVALVRTMHTAGNAARVVHRDLFLPPSSIVFVGRMSYSANAEAALAFCRDVFPLVLRAVPDAKLFIVGADPGRQVQNLASDAVAVTGRVADVRPFYASAAVAVVPVKMATGVQMKLIEALAARAPVVCETTAAVRAGVIGGVHCAVAADPQDWANQIVTLMTTSSIAAQFRHAGYEWVEAEHSSIAVSRQLDNALNSLLAKTVEDGQSRMATAQSEVDVRLVEK